MRPRPQRRGATAIWAILVFSLLAVLSTAATRQFLILRKSTELRERRLQATWLARGGAELGLARLLVDPSETKDQIDRAFPGAEVRWSIAKDPAAADTFRIDCEVRYAPGGAVPIVQVVSRSVRRIRDGDRVRIQALELSAGSR